MKKILLNFACSSMLLLAAVSVTAGVIQIKVADGIQSIRLYKLNAVSPFDPTQANPSHYCVPVGGLYYDHLHLQDVGHPCTKSENSTDWAQKNFKYMNQMLALLDTYQMPIFQVTEIDGVTAPASCTKIMGYDYESNVSYHITVTKSNCSIA